MHVPRLLICGFGGFPSAPRNPAGAAVEALAASGWNPPGAHADFMVAPVAWAGSVEAIAEQLAHAPADGVLLVGVAVGATTFRVETLARNRAATSQPDGYGEVWRADYVVPDGPDRAPVTAPWEAMKTAISQAGLPAELSADPGDYLCNFTLFRLLDGALAPHVGFLHVPAAREFSPAAAFGLQDIEAAVRAAATAFASSLTRPADPSDRA